MKSSAKLPKVLWIEALKTIVYIVNRVPTKTVLRTPFELFKDWKPSLQHITIDDAYLKREFITYKRKR